MRILVIQFLRGEFDSSKDRVLLSTNPRSRSLRDFLFQSPQHEFIMLSINRDFRAQMFRGKPRMLFYDVPPTRILWLFYIFLLSLLSRPRLMICFNVTMIAVASVASTLTGCKMISVLGSDIDFLDREYRLPRAVAPLARAMVRFSLRKSSYVFVPNRHVMNSAKKLADGYAQVREFKYKVSEIFAPSAVREKRDRSRNPVILTVARLSPVKGLEYLVLAAKEVLKSIPDATFLIQSTYSDPRYQARLEALMTKEGVREHFTFNTRPVPNSDMPAIYNSADLFVLPSLSEGRNNAILEAMACGLPVVATRVGANEEVVVDSENGFLVEPGDAPSMGHRIIEILKNDALWQDFSQAARSSSVWSEEYDLGGMLIEATANLTKQG